MSLTDTPDLAYLAGFLDGEGCFTLRASGGGYLRPSIHIVNTYRPTLDELAARCGASVRVHQRPRRANHRLTWVVSVTGLKAVTMALSVLPHLREKRLQAEALIECARRRRLYNRWPKADEVADLLQLLSDAKRGIVPATSPFAPDMEAPCAGS